MDWLIFQLVLKCCGRALMPLFVLWIRRNYCQYIIQHKGRNLEFWRERCDSTGREVRPEGADRG